MDVPVVSIGLPLRNSEGSVRAALDSLLRQDFQQWELVIADNASTDGTYEICRQYAARDSRIHVSRNAENIGVTPNHNRVFQLSRGEYFMWLAHDVELLPGMVSRCLAEHRRHPGATALVYAHCEMLFDDRSTPVVDTASIGCEHRRAYRRVHAVVHRNLGMVNQLYGLMRRDILARTRLCASFRSSDFVLLAELAMLGTIREIPEVLVRRRIRRDSGTAAVCRDARAWLQWVDPNASPDWLDGLPVRERLAIEYARGAWRLPLDFVDKCSCVLLTPWMPYWRLLLRATGPLRSRLRRVGGD